MQADAFSLSQYPLLSGIIKDFIEDKADLQPFHHGESTFESLRENAKTRDFNPEIRKDLCHVLKQQYASIESTEEVSKNLELLADDNTKVLVTGHQICLLTGPVFSLLKIASVINIARQLTESQPEFPVVPVFWMATEDHDFEEVNHIFIKGDKHEWNTEQGGAVGRMDVTGLGSLLDELETHLAPNVVASEAWKAARNAYTSGTFADATRALFHHLFGEFGLVILDADDPVLKKHYTPYMKNEVLTSFSQNQVEESSRNLEEMGYKAQVTGREVNLFYLQNSVRSRLNREPNRLNRDQNSIFSLVDNDQHWTTDALIKEMDEHPERFSPNVILRPLYQEVILPNIAYVGGPGELAYWLQLKGVFQDADVPMPFLILRQMAYFIPGFIQKKMDKSGHDFATCMKGKDDIIREVVNIEAVDLEPERASIEESFTAISQKLESIDASLKNSVQAELAKALKGIANVESRMARAIKRKNEEQMSRIEAIDTFLFPGGGPHERKLNWFEILSWFEPDFLKTVVENSDPLKKEILAFKPY